MNIKLVVTSTVVSVILLAIFVAVFFRAPSSDETEFSKEKVDIAITEVVSEVESDIESEDESVEKEDVKDDFVPSDNYTTLELATVSNPESIDVTVPPEFKRLSFVAVGDNIIHSSIYSDAMDLAAGTGQEYNFLPIYENVADIIKEADLAYVNQEAPIAGKERTISGYPMFNSPDQVGYDLIELGFDIVNLANNHMLDRYAAGYQRTIDFWKDKEGITYIGGYENREDYNNIRVVEKNGISIAFLSYTYGTNGINLDKGSQMIVPLCDESGTAEIDRMTKLAREKADIVIVSIHWGHEDWFKPSDLQKEQMQVMVNNGVDVILGTHPHVLQPMMWQDRPDGGRTLVVYSMGNFLSGMLYVRNMVGGIAGFDLLKAGDHAYVSNPYFIPTVSHYDLSWRGFKLYKFSEYTEDLYNRHRTNKISDPGHDFSYMRKIIDDAIPNEFLIEDFYREEQ